MSEITFRRRDILKARCEKADTAIRDGITAVRPGVGCVVDYWESVDGDEFTIEFAFSNEPAIRLPLTREDAEVDTISGQESLRTAVELFLRKPFRAR
jgi:acetamidase/formamidase